MARGVSAGMSDRLTLFFFFLLSQPRCDRIGNLSGPIGHRGIIAIVKHEASGAFELYPRQAGFGTVWIESDHAHDFSRRYVLSGVLFQLPGGFLLLLAQDFPEEFPAGLAGFLP